MLDLFAHSIERDALEPEALVRLASGKDDLLRSIVGRRQLMEEALHDIDLVGPDEVRLQAGAISTYLAVIVATLMSHRMLEKPSGELWHELLERISTISEREVNLVEAMRWDLTYGIHGDSSPRFVRPEAREDTERAVD